MADESKYSLAESADAIGGYTVVSARAPRWVDQAHSAVSLMVVFSKFLPDGEVSFTASPHDSEAHGRELYERAIYGEFGDIQEPARELISATSLAVRDDRSDLATGKISELLVEIETLQDAIDMNMSSDGDPERMSVLKRSLLEWRKYRVELGRIDQIEGFPLSFKWPSVPSQ